ncbi:EfeM/EfeO family lipoprotein [Curtobacterium sp. ISL-83]|uniref:EfeM/EfeO family lipoprotein n=1 Tax=Curtobacterium sp. ISL-83 TaxID=2819145 RepID=UPI001BEAFCEC|nr:EfeM/EfeO family lipoprotein [Curtobacterium sp. ISL-83]MBT2502691.1 EfeM/EfeO family lipoprotein [Curtobacterium sp. ISL-83]
MSARSDAGRPRRTAVAVTLGVLVAGAVAAAVVVPRLLPHAATPGSTGAYTVGAGTDVCGTGWPGGGTAPSAGTQTLRIRNTSVAGVEVQLVGRSSGAVFLDAEGLGSGAAHTYRVRLARGDYHFRCLPADGDPVDGPVVHVSGAAHVSDATPGVVPVTRDDLIPAAKTYGTWIESRLPVLLGDVRRLDDDVHAGDRTAARVDWRTAHVEYEQLGAAYGAFGDEDTAINGLPASGHTALDDPHLTGFHRIEALLWAPTSGAGTDTAGTSAATAPADALVAAVQHLQQTFPTARVDPLEIGLRAHEILENAVQFEATGRSDAGSHTSLATIDANVAGTVHALDPLRGILRTRYPELADTDRALATLRTELERHRRPDGTWTALDALGRPDRERLDAALGDAVERLAPVAAICDPRRTS